MLSRTLRVAFSIASCLALSCGSSDAGRDVIVQAQFFAPSSVMYSADDGPWLPAQPVGQPGVFHVTAANYFKVLAVCENDDGSFDAEEAIATVDDEVFLFPTANVATGGCAGAPTNATTVNITGQMAQAGTVAIGYGFAGSTLSPWSFSVDVAPDTYDLLAMSWPLHRVLIRRDLDVTGDTQLAPIDLEGSEGVALQMVPVSVTGALTGSQVWTSVSLSLHNTSDTVFSEAGSSAGIVPASATRPSDQQQIDVIAQSADAIQEGLTESPGDHPSVTMLPPPTVTFAAVGGTLDASWPALPDDLTKLELVSQSDTSASRQHVTITGAALARLAPSHVAADVDVPGYSPAWIVDANGYFMRYLTVERHHPPDLSRATVFLTGQQP